MCHPPLVVAHDGCEDSVPHTIDTVHRGLAAAADVVEVDIRVTRDGVVIIRHDPSLLVDGQTVLVSDMTYSELEALQRADRLTDPGPVGPITRLEVILNEVRRSGATANLDVKEDAVVEPAVQVVRDFGMREEVLFSGCETPRARQLKAHHRDFQVLLNISESQYRVAVVDYGTFARTICDEATEAGCCALNLYHYFCKEELVRQAHRRFLPVAVWTVDEPEAMRRFLAMGVDAITTNRVTELRSLM